MAQSQRIKVEITGPTGSGKSKLLTNLANVLNKAGFIVDVNPEAHNMEVTPPRDWANK